MITGDVIVVPPARSVFVMTACAITPVPRRERGCPTAAVATRAHRVRRGATGAVRHTFPSSKPAEGPEAGTAALRVREEPRLSGGADAHPGQRCAGAEPSTNRNAMKRAALPSNRTPNGTTNCWKIRSESRPSGATYTLRTPSAGSVHPDVGRGSMYRRPLGAATSHRIKSTGTPIASWDRVRG